MISPAPINSWFCSLLTPLGKEVLRYCRSSARMEKRRLRPTSSPPPVVKAKLEEAEVLESLVGKYEPMPCAQPTRNSPNGVNLRNLCDTLGPPVKVVKLSPCPSALILLLWPPVNSPVIPSQSVRRRVPKTNPPFMSKHEQPPGGAFARTLLYPTETS